MTPHQKAASAAFFAYVEWPTPTSQAQALSGPLALGIKGVSSVSHVI